MILTGTVASIANEACDSVDVTLAVQRPYPGHLTLHIGSNIGEGFLPDEWRGTFWPGQEVQFGVDEPTNDNLIVTGFRVGDYQRGYLI